MSSRGSIRRPAPTAPKRVEHRAPGKRQTTRTIRCLAPIRDRICQPAEVPADRRFTNTANCPAYVGRRKHQTRDDQYRAGRQSGDPSTESPALESRLRNRCFELPFRDGSGPCRRCRPQTGTAQGDRYIDGEIVISAEMATQSAVGFGWSTARELELYLVHGLLHLCGYDDGTGTERRLMRRRERSILKLVGD